MKDHQKQIIKKALLIAAFSIFVLFELTMFVLYIFTDVLPGQFECFAIFACFVFAFVYTCIFGFDRRVLFLLGGLFLINTADIFLVILYQKQGLVIHQCIGVTIFVLAQMCFMLCIHNRFKTKLFKYDAIVRGSLTFFEYCICSNKTSS